MNYIMKVRFTRNILAQVAARIVHVVCSLVVVRIIVEFLGKDGYGTYGFITATILMFATVADWGTQMIAVREASQNLKDQRALFGTTLLVRLGLSLVAIAVVIVAFGTYGPWQQFVVPATVASLVLFLLAFKNSLVIIFQTKLLLERASLVEIVGSVSFVVLTVVALWYRPVITSVMLGWVAATALALLIGLLLLVKITPLSGVRWNSRIFVRLVKESLPMGMLLVVFSTYNRVDIILLQHFQGLGAVAVYDLAYRVYGNVVLGAVFVMNALFPLLSRFYKQGSPQLKDYYYHAFGILAVMGLVVAVIVWITAGPIIQLFTGANFPQFGESVTAVKILMVATFIAYLNHLTGYGLIAFGKQRLSLVIGLAALIFNIALNVILIPVYSWLAAAIITGMTELLVLVMSSLVMWRTLGFLPTPRSVLQTSRLFIQKRGTIF